MIPQQDNKWEFCSRDYAQAGSIVSGSAAGASGYPVAHVIDGHPGTFFKHSGSLPAVITIDLGVSRTLDRFAVRCPMLYGVQTFAVSVSLNGSDYSAAAISFYGNYREQTGKSMPVTGRYVRFTLSALPDGVDELRVHELRIFTSQFVCDGLFEALSKQMPPNPSSRSGSRNGKILVPLLHGANFRVQRWGASRRRMTVTFPSARRDFLDLIQRYEDGGTFGLFTHEMQFHNVIIMPEGLRWNEIESDGPRPTVESHTLPSRTWYEIEMDVQEVYDPTPISEDEIADGSESGVAAVDEFIVGG